ncbi:unnamed protein product [Malus baccata var. baccata]
MQAMPILSVLLGLSSWAGYTQAYYSTQLLHSYSRENDPALVTLLEDGNPSLQYQVLEDESAELETSLRLHEGRRSSGHDIKFVSVDK